MFQMWPRCGIVAPSDERSLPNCAVEKRDNSSQVLLVRSFLRSGAPTAKLNGLSLFREMHDEIFSICSEPIQADVVLTCTNARPRSP